jgi:polysaccharide export outer membrane protein
MKRLLKIFFLSVTFLLLGLHIKSYANDYIIGPQDVLDVVVWKEDNLTKSYTVDKDGNIGMPYLQEVKVGGLSAKESADFIAQRLKNEGYLVDPVVTVSVKEYRSQKIMVFGTVKQPGEFYLKGRTLVLDLLPQIEYTGGDNGRMVITRKSDSGEDESITVDLRALLLNGDITQNIRILPGDSILVGPNSSTQPADVPGSDNYLIGPDDVLDVVVWKEDNLTKTCVVDKEGTITLPYIKKVKLAGLTVKGAADLIAARLKDEGYLVNPVVTVSVKEYRSQKIMVFGMVKTPGDYYLKDKTYVLDLLPEIQQSDNANESGKMVILRKKSSGEEESLNVDLRALLLNGDLSQNVEVRGGDKIIISRISSAQQIYVLGEVKNPGPYTVERDMSVLEALRMAGGFTDFANKNKAKIIREENGKKTIRMINLNKIRKGDKEEDVPLQAGDVLVALKSWF